jgi:hypothetical protein
MPRSPARSLTSKWPALRPLRFLQTTARFPPAGEGYRVIRSRRSESEPADLTRSLHRAGVRCFQDSAESVRFAS